MSKPIKIWLKGLVATLLTLDLIILTVTLASIAIEIPFISLPLSIIGIVILTMLLTINPTQECSQSRTTQYYKTPIRQIHLERFINRIKKFSSIFSCLACLKKKILNSCHHNDDKDSYSNHYPEFYHSIPPR